MPNNIYPDLTNSKHDIKYIQARILPSDVISLGTLVSRDDDIPLNIEEETGGIERCRNVDGGYAAAIYLSYQLINGGGANG